VPGGHQTFAENTADVLHEHGINIRKLGYVRSHVCSAAVRNVLLHEILARAIKNQLRLRLRQKTKEVGQSPSSPTLPFEPHL
jgi:hypothetical protein